MAAFQGAACPAQLCATIPFWPAFTNFTRLRSGRAIAWKSGNHCAVVLWPIVKTPIRPVAAGLPRLSTGWIAPAALKAASSSDGDGWLLPPP